MEFDSDKIVQDSHDGNTKNASSKPIQLETAFSSNKKHNSATENEVDSAGDVNMEASISANDMIRAGGFGARDDISSVLPVASDSTDFEASLRDARDYEEPQKDICRPGLGWKDVVTPNPKP